MPTKPLGPCRWPGCPNLQDPKGQGYCREHLRERWKQDAAKRGSARQRGYTKQYERAREWVLKRHPLCAVCRVEGRITPATVTHHIVPLAEGGTNSADNLLPVCKGCHDRLHSAQGRELLRKALEAQQEKPGGFFW